MSTCYTYLSCPTSSRGYGRSFCLGAAMHNTMQAGRLAYHSNSPKPNKTTNPGCTIPHARAQLTTSQPTYPPSTYPVRLPSAQEAMSLKMPPLHSTFPSLVHPDYELVKVHCDEWIEAVVHSPSPQARRFLLDCLLPLLVCRTIPTAPSGPRLVHVIKMISWLMISDEEDDDPDVIGSDYAATSHRASRIMAILLADDDHESCSGDRPYLSPTTGVTSKFSRMLEALSELWDEIHTTMTPCLRRRFITNMADYLEGIKVQATYRRDMRVPDKVSYIEIRRQASFTIPFFVLLEYAHGIELDEATFQNRVIVELRNVALDYISLCNDVISCPREIGVGDFFNLPSILYNSTCIVDSTSPLPFKAEHTSLQSAVDHVAQLTYDLNSRFISLMFSIKEESKHLDPTMVPHVNTYVDALSLSMSGALTWFLETARYKNMFDCPRAEN